LFITSSASPLSQQPDIVAQGVVEQFRVASGGIISIDLPLAKAALLHLGKIWPASEDFANLISQAQAILRQGQNRYECTAGDVDQFCQFLLATYGSDMVDLHYHRPRYLPTASDRPKVSALVRLEARRGGSVTSQRHVTINIADSMARHLLMSLDGARDRQQLLDYLRSIVNANSLNSAAPGDSQETLPFNFGLAELDEKLSNLARLALLIG
jgi:hypothetical protein